MCCLTLDLTTTITGDVDHQEGKRMNTVQAIELTPSLKQYVGKQIGRPAQSQTISIDTPLLESQRDLRSGDVKKYIEKIGAVNWDLFEVVTAVQLPNGEKYIINGQHRTSVVKTLLPDVVTVPANIIEVADIKTAHKYFGLMNGGVSRNVNGEERFTAEVMGEDKTALHYKHWLDAAHLSCGRINQAPDVPSVKFPTFKKCVDLNPEMTVYAADLLKTAYPGKWIDAIMHGLVRLFSSFECTKEIQDEESTLRKEFTRWFTKECAVHSKLSDLRFIQHRDATDWSYGVAYGVWNMFHTYMGNHPDFKNTRFGRSIRKKEVVDKYIKQTQNTKESELNDE